MDKLPSNTKPQPFFNTKPQLSYNIVEQTLTGFLGKHYINVRAVSGGRAGSRTAGTENFFMANNPFMMGQKRNEKKPDDGSIGGPLPIGFYTLANHEHKPRWIRLIPDKSNSMHDRDWFGFAIHGHGPRGSDGCIVLDTAPLDKLYNFVKSQHAAKLPPVRLEVFATGDLDRFMIG